MANTSPWPWILRHFECYSYSSHFPEHRLDLNRLAARLESSRADLWHGDKCNVKHNVKWQVASITVRATRTRRSEQEADDEAEHEYLPPSRVPRNIYFECGSQARLLMPSPVCLPVTFKAAVFSVIAPRPAATNHTWITHTPGVSGGPKGRQNERQKRHEKNEKHEQC